MSVLRDLWNSISHVGLIEDMDERLMRKIKLTNQICVVACIMTMGQIFAAPELLGHVLLCIACTISYVFTWVLNHYHKWNASRLYFCIASCIGITFAASSLSNEPNIAFKFIILEALVLPLIVFDTRDKWLSIAGIGIFVLTLALMDTMNAAIPMFDGVDPEKFSNPIQITINSILVVVNLYLGYRYLQNLNYTAEEGLAASLALSNAQKEVIEAKNKDIEDSINYAQRIQKAILPDSEDIRINLPDHFVYYQPKEKIGGDFFWYGESGNHIIFASVDCTGHGTPGALISIIGSKLLDKIVKEHNVTNPAEILELMNLDIISTLHNEWSIASDGMDVTLVSIDTWQRKVTFAGAKNSLLLMQDGKLKKLRGDRASIGDVHILEDGFTNQTFKLNPSDAIYMFTDGVIDQFGGPKNRKLMNQRFQSILESNHEYSMNLQLECLKNELQSWKGNAEQVDDILVIGLRIDFEHINIMKRFRDNKHLSTADLWPKAS